MRLGIGTKLAWVQNDADRRTTLTANSLNAGGPGIAVFSDRNRKGTILTDFEFKFIYRFSYNWAFRASYYAIAADDIAFGTADRETARAFVTANPVPDPAYHYNSLVVQGSAFGLEYIW